MDEVPKWQRKKKKTIVIEAKYTGDYKWAQLFCSNEWFTWNSYATEQDAENALKQLQKKDTYYEYRIRR